MDLEMKSMRSWTEMSLLRRSLVGKSITSHSGQVGLHGYGPSRYSQRLSALSINFHDRMVQCQSYYPPPPPDFEAFGHAFMRLNFSKTFMVICIDDVLNISLKCLS